MPAPCVSTPEAPRGLERRVHGAVPIDEGIAGIRPQHRVEHAQRGRLAGAIGAEEPGDAPVAALSRLTSRTAVTRRSAWQMRGLDHGAGPLR